MSAVIVYLRWTFVDSWRVCPSDDKRRWTMRVAVSTSNSHDLHHCTSVGLKTDAPSSLIPPGYPGCLLAVTLAEKIQIEAEAGTGEDVSAPGQSSLQEQGFVPPKLAESASYSWG